MTRARTEKHWPTEKEVNEKHEEGGVKGLREDCACLIIGIIICNHLPARTMVVLHGEIIPGQRKRKNEEVRKKKGSQIFRFPPLLFFQDN